MGNDGGSIPGRRDLVREKPKEIKIDVDVTAKPRAQLCALTKQPLKTPIAVCRLGLLYNYESIINKLMNKTMPGNFDHIQRTKDVREINLVENKNVNAEFPLVCPLSKIEYNGLNKFLVNWSCGCILSERALKEIRVGSATFDCIVCGKEYKKSDLISLNLSTEEQAALKETILNEKKAQREKAKVHKKESSKTITKKQDLEEHEVKKNKKTKKDDSAPAPVSNNILDKISDAGSGNTKTQVYSSLFHKEYKASADQMMFHNVRFGTR